MKNFVNEKKFQLKVVFTTFLFLNALFCVIMDSILTEKRQCMNWFKKYSIFIGVILVLTACSPKAPTKTEEEQKVSESLQSGLGMPIIRSESVVKKDSVSGLTLTTQQSNQIGTQISIGIYDTSEVSGEVFDELFLLIDHYEMMISKNIESTELSKINQMAGKEAVQVSDDLYAVIKAGLEYAEVSHGYFDISIGAVVNLWDIGGEHQNLPEASAIEAATSKVQYKDVVLDDRDHSVMLKKEGMVLDLGGIAKGYISDKVGEKINEKGYTSAIINFGGNVYGVGAKPGDRDWVVGVRNPMSEGIVGTIAVKNKAVISSGVYERFFTQDGVRYHHIINPKTGYPEQNDVMSVTIITDKGVDGDALSTTLFLMGLEKGLAYAEENPMIEVIFITSDSKIYSSSGVEGIFNVDNTNFEWVHP